MILILSILLVVAGFFAYREWNNRHLYRLQEALGGVEKKRSSSIFSKIKLPSVLGSQKKNLLLTVLPPVFGIVLCLFYFHLSPVFGLVIGGVTPYLIVSWVRKRRQLALRTDQKTSLDFASAIFGAGGTVEEWVQEVVPRLAGPLRSEYALGAQQLRQNIPITNFLEQLLEKSDGFYYWAIGGILKNYRAAGDLQTFISEVMKGLQKQERYERKLKMEKRKADRMLAFIAGFPVFLFLIFQDTVNAILARSVIANIVLFFGLVGYIAIFVFGTRMSRPKAT